MKQRVLSVALALCLCISSQSVAYASQEDTLQQKDVLTEDPAEKPEGDDEEISAPLPPLEQEDILPNETEDGSDISDDAAAAPLETSLQ